jgi:hypothetical protein
MKKHVQLGDNNIVFENFMVSIGDLMVSNWAYWRHNSGAWEELTDTDTGR